MVAINPERLLADLHELRSFGATGTGVVRTAYSEVDIESRHWLVGRMSEAGLDARIDGIGNVIGKSRNSGRALLTGSHSDTQPTGGWLDGAMGVIYGLEAARALREYDETRHLPLDVASWIDEEGAYFTCFGSRFFCNDVSHDQIARTEVEGRTLSQVIAAAGFGGAPFEHLDEDRYMGYLEAHIEQGPYLEAEAKAIGVVTAIVGIRDYSITFCGAQNHAGTTPMPLRRDAGKALIDLAGKIDGAFSPIAGKNTVWTIGMVKFVPGEKSIIPGRAEMALQIRDPDNSTLDTLETEVRALVEAANKDGPVTVSLEPFEDRVEPAVMDAGLQDALAAAAEQHAPGAWVRMPSGAGHDAQVIAKRIPSAMLFVPSIGGISHDFAEDTLESDIVLGCQVFTTAAAAILTGS